MTTTGKPGTIIHATLRPQDLLPAFLRELLERSEKAFNDYFSTLEGSPLARLLHYKTLEWDCEEKALEAYVASEECLWDLEALIDALGEHAPEGHYFGAHPGDGSDFGFWENE
mgnify:FL=1